MKTHYWANLIGALLLSTANLANAMEPEQIVQQSQQAFYYAATDMRARVVMRLLDADGYTRNRDMTMLRHNSGAGGKQKYFIYFHQPGDVRRMTFMVWKDPTREDQRWLFIPAVDLVRRIAADDKRSSFVGSDFTYEDISGRDLKADNHTLLREELVGNRKAYVIQSLPRETLDYSKRIVWIDEQNFLPLKEEYYDVQNELFRVFSADRLDTINGWPTITQRTMKNVKTGHRTEVTFESVIYDVKLDDEDFSERRMRQPPRVWIE